MKTLLSISIIILISSCALFNDDHVIVPFTSNPAGAKLYINKQYVGKTPIEVNVVPNKDKMATFVYDNQRKNVTMKTLVSIRENRNKTLDSVRCFLDALGLVLILPASSFMSVKCKDFNKKIYNTNFSTNANHRYYENYSY